MIPWICSYFYLFSKINLGICCLTVWIQIWVFFCLVNISSISHIYLDGTWDFVTCGIHQLNVDLTPLWAITTVVKITTHMKLGEGQVRDFVI